MIAIIWLIMAFVIGWRLGRLIWGDAAGLLNSLAGPASAAVFFKTPWPLLLFRLAAAIWLGILPLTWLTYGLAALLSPLLPLSVHPLLVVNVILLTGGLIWTAIGIARRRHSVALTQWPSLMRSLQNPHGLFYLAVFLVWIVFSCWLMISTFYQTGGYVHAGYSVFSDFAPHTALVSSFSQGRNWPTVYPHFPGDGISYHFMFYFLCGNLNYLGLPLTLAINLPSILGMVSFCLLLGVLALRLTGRRQAFLLAPLLLFCRSSLAFLTFLQDLAGKYGLAPRAWPDILRELWQRAAFIGRTTHDDWGLWGVNVYANQRHFLSGLALALIVLILFLPDLQAGLGRPFSWRTWFGKDSWLVRAPDARRRTAAAVLICLLLPYWHGSVLVALLLILLPIALFSVNRLAFLLTAAVSVVSALLQSWFFTGQATRVVQPAFYFGFIAADRTPAGVLAYLLEMAGLALPLACLVFWLPGRRRKILLAAFSLPLIFAFTVSLTPDVTVNHKYIMISLALANIYLADLLIRLWSDRRSIKPDNVARPNRTGLFVRRLAAVALAAALMVTGLEEIIIVRNINRNTVSLDLNSPLVAWIKQNTKPDAIFVSAPYHYNTFYLSGRSTWLGHSYYAWSAGHDTGGRFEQEYWLLSGGDHDLAAVQAMIQAEGLSYLLLDDTLREHADFLVDEAFFADHFALVKEFADLGHLKIYDLTQVIG